MASAALETFEKKEEMNARAEKLVLVNLSDQAIEGWLQAMRDAGQPWHSQVLQGLTEAKAILQAEPDTYAVICHDVPEVQVAREIGVGRVPSQALANWLNVVEPLLALYREYYQRITLVRSEDLYRKPKVLAKQLSKRSGIALGGVKVESLHADKVKTAPWRLAFQRLLALQALSHPPARRLAEELQLSSLSLLEKKPLLDHLDELFDQSETQQTWQNKLDDLQQENKLIVEQLHKTQEELEQYLLGHRDSSIKVASLERDIKRKNDKLHAFAQKNKRLTTQLKEARHRLDKLKQSKSWKITAPMRKVIKLLGGSKQRLQG